MARAPIHGYLPVRQVHVGRAEHRRRLGRSRTCGDAKQHNERFLKTFFVKSTVKHPHKNVEAQKYFVTKVNGFEAPEIMASSLIFLVFIISISGALGKLLISIF